MFTAAMIAPLPADTREFLAVMGLADEFTLEMAHFITETPHTEKLLTTLTVAAPRRLTGISVSGVSSTAAKNTTFDLTKAVVKQLTNSERNLTATNWRLTLQASDGHWKRTTQTLSLTEIRSALATRMAK